MDFILPGHGTLLLGRGHLIGLSPGSRQLGFTHLVAVLPKHLMRIFFLLLTSFIIVLFYFVIVKVFWEPLPMTIVVSGSYFPYLSYIYSIISVPCLCMIIAIKLDDYHYVAENFRNVKLQPHDLQLR